MSSEDKNEDKEVKTKGQIICDALCGIIMLVSIIVYLILGKVLNFWHPGWIIVVSGAVLCGIISIISNTCVELQKLKDKDKE